MEASVAPPLRKGVLHLLSGSVFGRGLNFGLNLLLSRVLGPSGLGLLTLVLTTAQTFEISALGGIDYGVSCALTGQDAAETKEARQKIALAATQFVGVTTFFLAIALWFWIVPFEGLLPTDIGASRNWISLGLVGISIIESLGSLPWVFFLILGETRIVALRQGLFAPTRLIGALCGSLIAAAPGAIAGYALISGLQWIWLRQRCKGLLHSLHDRRVRLVEVWRLASAGLPLYVANSLAGLIFLPLLANVANSEGVDEVGYLRIGQMVVQIFTLLPGALVPLLFLKLRSNSGDRTQMQNHEPALRLIWCLGLIALLLYLLIDRFLVMWFFGEVFLPSIQPTRVLVLCAVLDSANQVLHTPLLASRRTGIFSLGQNSGAVIAAVLGFWLIPSLGLQGYLIAKFGFSLIPVLIYSAESWRTFSSPKLIPMLLLATGAVTPMCWWSLPSIQLQIGLLFASFLLIIRCAWPLKKLVYPN